MSKCDIVGNHISRLKSICFSVRSDIFRLYNLYWFQHTIATNQRVVSPKRQQIGLVAVTVRGSVLFYSSAVQRPDFHSVTEFQYLYRVDSIELRTLFYL